MRKITVLLVMVSVLFLTACGGEEEAAETDELPVLEVEFNVPDSAEVGETVLLEAIVSYDQDVVEDADEVMFEYWLEGNEDSSTEVEGTHTVAGRYTAEVTFEEEGVYEIYAHTTAEGLHTMPLESIEIGNVE